MNLTNPKKLDAKARKGTFLGYDEKSPMYNVLMWGTRKVERSRKVILDEGSYVRDRATRNTLDYKPCIYADREPYNDLIADLSYTNVISPPTDISSEVIDNTEQLTTNTSEDIPLRRSTGQVEYQLCLAD